MTRLQPVDGDFQVLWNGALWREVGEGSWTQHEGASLLDGYGRDIRSEDPRLAGIKGPYQAVAISVKSSRDKRG